MKITHTNRMEPYRQALKSDQLSIDRSAAVDERRLLADMILSVSPEVILQKLYETAESLTVTFPVPRLSLSEASNILANSPGMYVDAINGIPIRTRIDKVGESLLSEEIPRFSILYGPRTLELAMYAALDPKISIVRPDLTLIREGWSYAYAFNPASGNAPDILISQSAHKEILNKLGWKVLTSDVFDPEGVLNGRKIGTGSTGSVYSCDVSGFKFAVKCASFREQKELAHNTSFLRFSFPPIDNRVNFGETQRIGGILSTARIPGIAIKPIAELAAAKDYVITEVGPLTSMSEVLKQASESTGPCSVEHCTLFKDAVVQYQKFFRLMRNSRLCSLLPEQLPQANVSYEHTFLDRLSAQEEISTWFPNPDLHYSNFLFDGFSEEDGALRLILIDQGSQKPYLTGTEFEENWFSGRAAWLYLEYCSDFFTLKGTSAWDHLFEPCGILNPCDITEAMFGKLDGITDLGLTSMSVPEIQQRLQSIPETEREQVYLKIHTHFDRLGINSGYFYNDWIAATT